MLTWVDKSYLSSSKASEEGGSGQMLLEGGQRRDLREIVMISVSQKIYHRRERRILSVGYIVHVCYNLP